MRKEDNREKYKEYDHRYYIKHRRPNSKIGKLETKISDLEAKLAESEKLAERLQQIVDKLRDKEFAGKTLVEAVNAVYEPLYKNKYDEAEELKQQLAEKEKRCEICGSKMILGELGYYCNNDELHPIYQAPNEAKSDYEKITLLKQDYDAMVEREELLRQQLTESKKQCQECKHLNKKIELNMKNKLMAENCELQKQLEEKEKEIAYLTKQVRKFNNEAQKYFEDAYCNDFHNQDKISFAVEVLKIAQDYVQQYVNNFDDMNDCLCAIDNQIKRLTHQHENKE